MTRQGLALLLVCALLLQACSAPLVPPTAAPLATTPPAALATNPQASANQARGKSLVDDGVVALDAGRAPAAATAFAQARPLLLTPDPRLDSAQALAVAILQAQSVTPTPKPAGELVNARDTEAQRFIKTTNRDQFYDVTGSSTAALAAQTQELGPPDETGKRWGGSADAHITWQFTSIADPQRCRVNVVNLDVQTVVTLPRWAAPATVAPAVKTSWDTYVAALSTHEQLHREIAQKYASDLYWALRDLPGERSCPELELKAKAVAQRILQEMASAQVAYDKETQHGITQGAVLK